MLIQRCESVVILLSAVISYINNFTSVINLLKLLSQNDEKDLLWLFYSALKLMIKKTSVRCLYCNAEVSAKVKKCPWHG